MHVRSKLDVIRESGKHIAFLFGGQFSPFYSAHYEIYKQLKTISSDGDSIWLLATNKVSLPEHAFSFDDKREVINTMFDIEQGSIICVKDMINPKEVYAKLDIENFVAVFIVGTSDSEKLEQSGFENIETATSVSSVVHDKKYYLMLSSPVIEHDDKPVLSNGIKNIFGEKLSKPLKKEFFKKIYGHFNEEIFDMIVTRCSIALEEKRDTKNPAYQAWRNAVFARDSFTCALTGQRGGQLEAHHIERWADNKKLRFQVSNGITLSKDAHGLVNGREDQFADQFKRLVAERMEKQRANRNKTFPKLGKGSTTKIVDDKMRKAMEAGVSNADIVKMKRWNPRNPRSLF